MEGKSTISSPETKLLNASFFSPEAWGHAPGQEDLYSQGLKNLFGDGPVDTDPRPSMTHTKLWTISPYGLFEFYILANPYLNVCTIKRERKQLKISQGLILGELGPQFGPATTGILDRLLLLSRLWMWKHEVVWNRWCFWGPFQGRHN